MISIRKFLAKITKEVKLSETVDLRVRTNYNTLVRLCSALKTLWIVLHKNYVWFGSVVL